MLSGSRKTDGGARDRVGRRDRGMDDRGFGQSRRPGVQFCAIGHCECEVVQTDSCLIECTLAAASMLGQPQPNLKAVVAQEHLAARPVRRLEFANSSEPEYVHVPGRTRVNVADRQAQMMCESNSGDRRRLTRASPVTGFGWLATSFLRAIRILHLAEPDARPGPIRDNSSVAGWPSTASLRPPDV